MPESTGSDNPKVRPRSAQLPPALHSWRKQVCFSKYLKVPGLIFSFGESSQFCYSDIDYHRIVGMKIQVEKEKVITNE